MAEHTAGKITMSVEHYAELNDVAKKAAAALQVYRRPFLIPRVEDLNISDHVCHLAAAMSDLHDSLEAQAGHELPTCHS